MGLMKIMSQVFSRGDGPDIHKTNAVQDIRVLLIKTTQFWSELQNHFYEVLASMTQETLHSKVYFILKLHEIFRFTKELISHMKVSTKTKNLVNDKREKQILQAHLGALKKMITRLYFYMTVLEKKSERIDHKLLKSLNKKELINIDEKEFTDIQTRTDIVCLEAELTEKELTRFWVLKNRAERVKNQRTANLFRTFTKRKQSNIRSKSDSKVPSKKIGLVPSKAKSCTVTCATNSKVPELAIKTKEARNNNGLSWWKKLSAFCS